jgi:hypothetical protein
MKRLLFLSLMMFISITSAACGADKFFGPTFTPTPTETLTPTDTTTITPTQTETPTPEFTDGIVPVYTETIDEKISGAEMHVQLITDKTVTENQTVQINKIFLSPHFVNSQGENASQALADLVAHSVYRAWQRNGNGDEIAARKQVGFDTYMKMVSECQDGTRDWVDVEYQATANDLTTPAYDLSKRTFRPGDLISLVFVDDTKFQSNMTEDIGAATQYTALAVGTHIKADGNLEIWINAFPNNAAIDWGEVQMANLESALLRLSWWNQGRALTGSDIDECRHAFSVPVFSPLVFVLTPSRDFKTPIMVDPTPAGEVNQP